MFCRMQHMVMVVPINTEIHETHRIREENRQHRLQTDPACILWCTQLEHHDGDNDGDDTVAECFKAIALHGMIIADAGQPISKRARLPRQEPICPRANDSARDRSNDIRNTQTPKYKCDGRIEDTETHSGCDENTKEERCTDNDTTE